MLTVAYLNIEGLFKWVQEPNFLAFMNKFDVIAFGETFSTNEIQINDFSLISHKPALKIVEAHSNRSGRHSGGISVYSRKGVCAQNIATPGENLLACQVNGWVLAFAYVPPQGSKYANKRWAQGIEEALFSFCTQYDRKVVLMGDMNCRIGEVNELRDDWYYDNKEINPSVMDEEVSHDKLVVRNSKDKFTNPYGKQLIEMCKATNFCIINGRNVYDIDGEFTFCNHNGSSVIDLCLTHIVNYDSVTLEVGEQLFSSHFPIQVVVKEAILKKATVFTGEKIPIYKFSEKAHEEVLTECETKIPEFLSLTNYREGQSDTTEKLGSFLEIVSNAIKRFKIRPRKNKSVKNKLSENAAKALSYLRSSRRGNLKHGNKFLKYRSAFKREMKIIKKEKKKDAELELLDLYRQRNMGQLWKRINRPGKKRDMSTETISPKEWVAHFSNLYNVDNVPNGDWEIEWGQCEDSSELDKTIEESEISSVIKKLKVRKACGRDGISNKIVKNLQHCFIPFLIALFNQTLEQGNYPDQWKKIMIIPIFKRNGSPNDVNNYRGIGLLTTFQKIFNKIIQSRMYEWAEGKRLLPRFQAGFRKNHSTINQVFVLRTLAEKYLNRQQSLFVAFVDYNKFFDSIQRHVLWAKLSSMGISRKMLTLLISMYTDTGFAVKFKQDEISKYTPTRTGVTQGDVLSPLLANLFTSDFESALGDIDFPHFPYMNNAEVKMIQFADDLALISTTPIGLQRQLDALSKYCKSCGLSVNTRKTKVMVLKKGRKNTPRKWNYEGKELEQVTAFRYLGIVITPDLKMKKHLDTSLNKAKSAMYGVSRFIQSKQHFPLKLSINLGHALVQSVFTYGIELNAWEDQEAGNKLMRTFYKKCMCLPIGAPSLATEMIIGRRSFEVTAAIRGFKFWRKLLGQEPGSLLFDAFAEQRRQMDMGRVNWLSKAKNRLDRLGFSEFWTVTTLTPEGERTLIRKILNKLSDINFQHQLSTLSSLRSLAHLSEISLSPNGVEELLILNDLERIRLSAQLLLNCPGSLVRREQDLMICSSCSSPIANRNAFLHIFMSCINSRNEVKNRVAEKIDGFLPVPIQMNKLMKLIINKNKTHGWENPGICLSKQS